MTRKQPHTVLPGPDCAMFAPLLPLLDSSDLSPEEAARAREHLNTCAWCAREYAAHAIVDGALRRHFGELSPGAPPFLTMETIVNTADTQDPSTQPSTQPSTGFAPTAPLAEPPNPPQHRPGRLTGFAAVAAALLLMGLAATLFAIISETAHGPAQQSVPTATAIAHQPPTPLHLPAGATLMSLSMASPTDGWVLGMTADRQQVILLRYHNGQWSIWPGALPQLQLLLSVNSLSMDSPTDGWITGVGGFLHYSNNQWVAVAVPGIGAVEMVRMVSPTNGWARAFIQSLDKQNGDEGLLHYSNGAWSVVTLPAALNTRSSATAFDFAVTPTGECWLMYRDANTGDTKILRYMGSTFQVVSTLPHVQGETITMHSAQDGWLTATDATGKAVYHFDGSAWTKVTIPASFKQQPYLYHVVISPSGAAWLFGGTGQDSGAVARYLSGSWEVVEAPSTINPSTIRLVADDEGWAIGTAGDHNALYHYQNGSWTPYPN